VDQTNLAYRIFTYLEGNFRFRIEDTFKKNIYNQKSMKLDFKTTKSIGREYVKINDLPHPNQKIKTES